VHGKSLQPIFFTYSLLDAKDMELDGTQPYAEDANKSNTTNEGIRNKRNSGNDSRFNL
jgi:hypothetical protein